MGLNEFGKYTSFLILSLILFVLLLVFGYLLKQQEENLNPPLQWENANPNIEQTLKSISEKETFENASSPQYYAADWMIVENYSNQTEIITQRYVLAVLYYSTGGGAWLECNQNFTDLLNEPKTATPCSNDTDVGIRYPYLSIVPVCDWYGTYCESNRTHLLTRVELPSNGLSGTLPMELRNLTHLTILDLSNNTISGTIPFESLAILSNVTHINLNKNQFSGGVEFPIENNIYGSLQELNLGDNYLSAELSSSITMLGQLKTLDLSFNAMYGPLPDGMDKLVHLEKIELSQNEFSGTIPSEIASSMFLWYATFHLNKFTGTMPAEFCQRNMTFLSADCADELDDGYVECSCCTECCSYSTQTCSENKGHTVA